MEARARQIAGTPTATVPGRRVCCILVRAWRFPLRPQPREAAADRAVRHDLVRAARRTGGGVLRAASLADSDLSEKDAARAPHILAALSCAGVPTVQPDPSDVGPCQTLAARGGVAKVGGVSRLGTKRDGPYPPRWIPQQVASRDVSSDQCASPPVLCDRGVAPGPLKNALKQAEK
jgi:hypothetical protein